MSDAAFTAESPDAPPVESRRWTRALWLGLILLIAIAARGFHLGHESFQPDEFYSLEASTGRIYVDQQLPTGQILRDVPNFTALEGAKPWWSIPGSLHDDLQPPIYYLLLRGWRAVFGSDEFQVRTLSLAASVVAIVMLFGAVRELHGTTAALWAAAIMALAGPQIEHAQIARSYAMAQIPALGAAWAVARIQMRGSTPLRLVALGFCALTMLLVHYFTLGPLIAVGAYVLLRRGRQQSKAVVIALAVAIGLFAILWGPTLLAQRRHGAEHLEAAVRDTSSDPANTFARLALIPLGSLARPVKNSLVYGTVMAGIVAVLPLILLRRNPNLLLWLLWAYGSLGMLAVLDLGFSNAHLAFTRYWLFATPAIYALLATMLTTQQGLLRFAVPAIAVLYCALSIGDAYSEQHNWRWAGDRVRQAIGRDDVVVYGVPNSRWYSTLLYLAMRHYHPDMQGPVVILTEQASPALLKQLADGKKVWLITTFDPDVLPQLLPGFDSRDGVGFPFIGMMMNAVPRSSPTTRASSTQTGSTP